MFAAFLPCVAMSAFAEPGAQNDYAESLAAKAKDEKLWDDKYWHILMHYRKNLLWGVNSEVADKKFYNSPDGQHNPKEELEATLRAFFLPVAETPNGEEHPQCNFPARLKWLSKRLNIDASQLPNPKCERLEHWLASLNVNRVTLVFASYYIASPASMFGHTFLRLDRETSGADLELMDYGVGYAANMDTENPVLMAYKGMFGLFDGVFSTFPYYMKVQQYGNMESRDMWEYQLSLTDEQINGLLLHLWEVGSVRFRYFYFRENCAFELLALLESGNPDLRLTDQFQTATVPTQTVKALYTEKNLVARRIYRPSLTTRLELARKNMDESQTRVFKGLVSGKNLSDIPEYAPLSDEKKAATLDAFLDYQQYSVTRSRKDENEGLVKHSRNVLIERSGLPGKTEEPVPNNAKGPEEGHDSNKAALGFGANNAGGFERVSLRPAYNDLLSYWAGYSENSQIIYFDGSARIYNQTGKAVLEQFSLVDLVSITPYDPLYGGTSWRVGFGFRNLRDLGCEACDSFYVNFGDGYAVRAPFYHGAVMYALLVANGETAQKFDLGYRFGAGADAGILIEESDAWKTQVFGKGLRHFYGNVSNEYEYGVKQRYAMNKNTEFVLSLSRINDDNEAALSFGAYF